MVVPYAHHNKATAALTETKEGTREGRKKRRFNGYAPITAEKQARRGRRGLERALGWRFSDQSVVVISLPSIAHGSCSA